MVALDAISLGRACAGHAARVAFVLASIGLRCDGGGLRVGRLSFTWIARRACVGCELEVGTCALRALVGTSSKAGLTICITCRCAVFLGQESALDSVV